MGREGDWKGHGIGRGITGVEKGGERRKEGKGMGQRGEERGAKVVVPLIFQTVVAPCPHQ